MCVRVGVCGMMLLLLVAGVCVCAGFDVFVCVLLFCMLLYGLYCFVCVLSRW